MDLREQIVKVRARMLQGDKSQAFVSGDTQPGRPVELTDVKGRDDDQPERPPVGSKGTHNP